MDCVALGNPSHHSEPSTILGKVALKKYTHAEANMLYMMLYMTGCFLGVPLIFSAQCDPALLDFFCFML